MADLPTITVTDEQYAAIMELFTDEAEFKAWAYGVLADGAVGRQVRILDQEYADDRTNRVEQLQARLGLIAAGRGPIVPRV